MAGVWTALFLALALLLPGGVLRFLPKAVLAATIMVAVLSLVDLKPCRQAWRHSRLEFALMAMVAMLTLTVGVEAALGVGVLVAAGRWSNPALDLQNAAGLTRSAHFGFLPGFSSSLRANIRFQ
jgi:MFS superfamily sulfate permease-like transporter